MVERTNAGGTALSRSLARLNAIWLGVTVGLVAAAAVWLATIVLVVQGGPDTGANLKLLVHYLPGYDVTIAGAFLGAAWSFLFAFLLTAPAGWVYFLGVLRQVEIEGGDAVEADLGHRVTSIRVPEFAAAFGLLCGTALFLATLLLVLKHREGEPLGPRLNLLQQYLPAYSVSFPGSIIGGLYFLLFGALTFGCVALIYNRLVASRPLPGGRGRTS